jgi:hypothetical protein
MAHERTATHPIAAGLAFDPFRQVRLGAPGA